MSDKKIQTEMADAIDKWIHFNLIDFTDTTIKQIHVDTRDFHCLPNKKEKEKPLTNEYKVDKFPDRILHTPDEIRQLVNRLFKESGGDGEWRYLSLEGRENGWEFKYLRIYRFEDKWVVCNNQHEVMSKEILSRPIAKRHLGYH